MADTITIWNDELTYFGAHVTGNATIDTGKTGVADAAVHIDHTGIIGNLTLSFTAGTDSNVRIGVRSSVFVQGNALILYNGGNDNGSIFGGANSIFRVMGPVFTVDGGSGINTKPTIGVNSTLPVLFKNFQP